VNILHTDDPSKENGLFSSCIGHILCKERDCLGKLGSNRSMVRMGFCTSPLLATDIETDTFSAAMAMAEFKEMLI